ncbi:DNA-binding response regulator [Paenibacillus thermotolerans]|uniref:DNA-binding response regulator n=1 Tax=Paenibacillus thermotolerans TaxID=3027807 RepID=UPI002368A2EB|nr:MULTISPECIES: DNA-binding response regulator [unclassified Paenibacillus]
MKSEFDIAYEKFMKEQIAGSTGERRRRLTEVDRHAETLLLQNVWWPAFRNFNHLHAEYEVIDIRGGYRYLDYAWIIPPLWVNLEVEGFTPHTKNRRVFEDGHLRASYLQLEGWKVIRLSYDTVNDNPKLCQQILLQLAGKWAGISPVANYTEKEKAVIRLAIRLQRPITAGDVCAMAGVSDRTARRWLKALLDRGVFRPARGTERVHAYELCAEKQELFLGM